jgi:O-antigen ligase
LSDTHAPAADRALPVLDKVIQLSLIAFAAFSMFSISITQISFALGALSWLLKVHLTQTWKEVRGTLTGVAILCFCLACILSITSSIDWETSIGQLKKLLQLIILFWVANAVQNEKQRDLLVVLVIVAGVASALNGILPLLNPSFFAPERLYSATRPIGTMSVPATFSAIMMLAALLALGSFIFHKPKQYWVLGGAGIICLCLFLSLTRQAWLGIFVGTAFMLIFRKKKYLLFIPLLLAGLLLFAPDKVKDRLLSFTNLQDNSLQARVSLWKGGWTIFKDFPATGCGYKCVDLIHSQNPDPSGYIAHYRGMHSNVLQLLVDTGIIGFGAWLAIWATYFIEIFKRWRILPKEIVHDNTPGLLMGASAAVLAFLVGGFFETNIYDSEVMMLLYFLMGLSLTKVKKPSWPE